MVFLKQFLILLISYESSLEAYQKIYWCRTFKLLINEQIYPHFSIFILTKATALTNAHAIFS